MVDTTNCSSSKTSSHQDVPLVPKQEILDFDFPSHSVLPTNFEDNVASSSGSNFRSTFIGMGFQPSLVSRVIDEMGEDDFDLLLDALVAYSEGRRRTNSESSDSLDKLFDDDVASSPPEISVPIQPKKEPGIGDEVDDSKRASLLLMNFSPEEVNFALDKLGKNAPVDGLVDFIVAAQIAKRLGEVAEDIGDDSEEEKNEVLNGSYTNSSVEMSNEILFGTMDKTLHLLEMGFSESQVSWAIEKCGSELPISELADSIFTGRIPVKKSIATGSNCRSFSLGMHSMKAESESEGLYTETFPQQIGVNLERSYLGKKPKEEHVDESFEAIPRFTSVDESFEAIPHFTSVEREKIRKGKRPKPEYAEDSNLFMEPTYYEEKFNPDFDQHGAPKSMNKKPRKPLTGAVANHPYFLYGNVGNASHEFWVKISKFLYNLEPEFVNTHFFSALSRKEGYIHNLPTEERFEIDPQPPMSIEEAIPHTKKWWPPWDARKRLDYINSEVNGISQLCDRLEMTMINARGLLSMEQQRNILHHCRSLNLVWVGRNKLGPIEPEYLEIILGYPMNHTDAYSSMRERLQSLKYCFQVDTLGYQLSVLKSLYPGGLTVLSIFSGIGGAEIALHRLGIHLKAVVSIESSETKRRILKKWWQSSRQSGELVQIDDIQRLTSSRLSSFAEKFGCFDFVICQNPCSSSQSSKGAAQNNGTSGFDFSQFCEFSRILHRVRGMADRRR